MRVLPCFMVMGAQSTSMAQVSVRSCEICTQAPGGEFCQDCEQVFCNNCKTLHLRSYSSRNHTFKGQSAIPKVVSKRKPDNDPKRKPIKCSTHKEELIYYCEYCEEAACNRCVIQNHKGHTMADIVEVITKLSSSGIIDRFDREFDTTRQNIQKLESQLNKFSLDCEKICLQVEKKAKKAKDLIDKVASSMISRIRENNKKEAARISESINILKQSVERCEAMKAQVLGVNKDASAIPVLKTMLNEMEDYYSPDPTNGGTLHNCLNVINITNVEELLGRVEYEFY